MTVNNRNQMTIEEARYYFTYDENLGRLRWRNNKLKKCIGKIAGSKKRYTKGHSYYLIQLEKKRYTHHVLVYNYFKGYLPENCNVDHIIETTAGGTDHIENLQAITQSANIQKRGLINGREYKGVYLYNDAIHARIRVNGQLINLGVFETEAAAAIAYDDAARRYHTIHSFKNFPNEFEKAFIESRGKQRELLISAYEEGTLYKHAA